MLKVLIITLYALGALSNVLLIGEERKPITRGVACISVILNGLLIWGVINYL